MSLKCVVNHVDPKKLATSVQTVQVIHACKNYSHTIPAEKISMPTAFDVKMVRALEEKLLHAKDLNVAYHELVAGLVERLNAAEVKFWGGGELHVKVDDGYKAVLDNSALAANIWTKVAGGNVVPLNVSDDTIGSRFVREYVERIHQRGDLSVLPTKEIYQKIRTQRVLAIQRYKSPLLELMAHIGAFAIDTLQEEVVESIKSLEKLTAPLGIKVEKTIFKFLRRIVIFSKSNGFVNDFTLRLKIFISIGKRLFYIYPQDDENQGFTAQQLFPSLS